MDSKSTKAAQKLLNELFNLTGEAYAVTDRKGRVITAASDYADGFMRDLALGNILSADITDTAKHLKIALTAPRAVYLIQNTASDISPLQILRSIFPENSKDFICAISEDYTIVIKDLTDEKDPALVARVILDTLNAEALSRVYIGVSDPFSALAQVPEAYRQAQIALEIGRAYTPAKYISHFERLGLGRLVYYCPATLRAAFIEEVLPKQVCALLDDEIMLTINKFFEYSLNVSEASRQLYIHRNTLVYRLDKVQKLTGLDIRQFNDAALLYMAIMAIQTP